jgi:hypothetical protein
VVALFITQASVVEGYIVGGVMAVAALFGLWRLEQVDYPGKEVRGTFMKRKRAHR